MEKLIKIIVIFALLATFYPQKAHPQGIDEISSLEIGLMSSKELASMLEVFVGEAISKANTAYDIFKKLSNLKMSYVLNNITSSNLRNYLYKELAGENLIRAVRVLTSCDSEIASSILDGFEEASLKAKIINTMKELAPAYYTQVMNY